MGHASAQSNLSDRESGVWTVGDMYLQMGAAMASALVYLYFSAEPPPRVVYLRSYYRAQIAKKLI